MIKTKKALILALAFPLLVLVALVGYRQYVYSFGTEVVFPISGYDPRDLLSGHYLIYRIDYDVDGICPSGSAKATGYICLEPKGFSYISPKDCSRLIRGVCQGAVFEAGIEKFYIPEEIAKVLEQDVRTKKASIVVSLTPSGQAQVKDLLIDGISWKNTKK